MSVETCPHYLNFASEEIPDGATIYKCAPPIRDADNREKIWQGLLDGVVDSIASDHSPCPREMKRLEEGDFSTAWGGISGLLLPQSVLFPIRLNRFKHVPALKGKMHTKCIIT